ncbi:DUF7269 family protein [Halobacterium litoreum]|uniref:DUF4129 domain-containing protein n=1 Tax=Halobacterium litoreum TaxID=2039234 RepID=A0ABD5NH19_9EURY|nr:hypothetical protein [Halobacterium litoreum]UHH12817.1 hypothetical protein LT972_11695 [Halobacterium litoreum]
MTVVRRVLLVFGLVFSLLGFAVVVQPGVVDTVRLPDVPTVIVGGFALLLGVTTYLSRRHTEFRDASDDEERNEHLEDRYEPPRPGADVDERLREGAGDLIASASGNRFRERMELLAIQVLVDARGVSREDAKSQLDDGTWTDDTTAASFFCNDIDPPAQDVFSTVIGRSTVYERQVHRVVAELQSIAGLDGGEA